MKHNKHSAALGQLRRKATELGMCLSFCSFVTVPTWAMRTRGILLRIFNKTVRRLSNVTVYKL